MSSLILLAAYCVACRRGKTNCCQRIGVLGVHIDGGMADYVCVPEANVAPADGITLDQAAMIEFLAIGAHAVRRASPRKGDRILVVGAGPIGIGCILFGKLEGARSQPSTSVRTGSTSARAGLASITRSPRDRPRAKRCRR